MIPSQLRLPHPYAQELVSDRAAVVAAYGGMGRATNQVLGTLGAAYVNIANYTEQRFNPNVNVTTDLVTGYYSVLRASVYNLSFEFGFTCTSVNTGRNFNARIFNVTDNVAIGDVFPIFVGRDTDGGSASASVLFNLPAAGVGKNLVLQLGGGDSLSTFTITHMVLSISGAGT